MKKEVNNSVKTRWLQAIEKRSSETLVKNKYQLKKPPKKEATETFWRSILENNREYNHSTERIKREGQKYADTECQP